MEPIRIQAAASNTAHEIEETIKLTFWSSEIET